MKASLKTVQAVRIAARTQIHLLIITLYTALHNNVGLQCTPVDLDSSGWGWQVVYCCRSSVV